MHSGVGVGLNETGMGMTERRQQVRPLVVCLAGCLVTVTAACGATSAETAPIVPIDVPETVALGGIPQPLSNGSSLPAPPTLAAPTSAPRTTIDTDTDTGNDDDDLDTSVAGQVDGNRVLLIGDSILASTAPRYGGLMCEVLTTFGWEVELAAESGRFIEFGDAVLDERLRPGNNLDWDAAGIFLGNNWDGDLNRFTWEMTALVERLEPRPTLIYTLSEWRSDGLDEINEFIRGLPDKYPNVVVIDWADITGSDPGALLAPDGLHLSTDGRRSLVLYTAAALGEIGPESGGECLRTDFDDDSSVA